MVNGFRYYRALESVSIAWALSTALTIYPCQIRVHQRWQSKLQLPTARKKECYRAMLRRARYCYGKSFVRPSVSDVEISWSHRLEYPKVISRLVSLGCSLSMDPTSRIYSKGTTQKFCLEGVLLLMTNRKSHTRFRLVPKSTAFDNLEGSLCTLF